jgi:hypothetical protein
MDSIEIILLLLFIHTFLFSFAVLEAVKYMNWKRKFRENKNG